MEKIKDKTVTAAKVLKALEKLSLSFTKDYRLDRVLEMCGRTDEDENVGSDKIRQDKCNYHTKSDPQNQLKSDALVGTRDSTACGTASMAIHRSAALARMGEDTILFANKKTKMI